jgi:hypothetical protein
MRDKMSALLKFYRFWVKHQTLNEEVLLGVDTGRILAER